MNTETQEEQPGPAAEATPEPAADEAPDAPAATGGDENEKKKGRGGLAVLALLIALIALGLAVFDWWQGGQKTASANQRVTQLAQEFDAYPARLEGALRAELGAIRKETQSLSQRVGSVQNQVGRVTQEVSSLTTADRTDWMLAEVEYLLRLASQRVLMEADLISAEVILQAADRVLLELDDSRLTVVRAALAEDIAAVRAAGALDVDGIFLRLSAVANQIETLPLIVPSRELGAAREALLAGAEQPVESGASGEEAVRNLLDRAWQQIRELVVVRRRDEAVKPLLPPSQEYYLRQNLRMLVEQAQLGLLRGSTLVYQDSLKAAREWIHRYFPANEAAVQGVLRSIDEVAHFDVSPRRPDVARGLRALQERQAARHWNTPSSPQAGTP